MHSADRDGGTPIAIASATGALDALEDAMQGCKKGLRVPLSRLLCHANQSITEVVEHSICTSGAAALPRRTQVGDSRVVHCGQHRCTAVCLFPQFSMLRGLQAGPRSSTGAAGDRSQGAALTGLKALPANLAARFKDVCIAVFTNKLQA